MMLMRSVILVTLVTCQIAISCRLNAQSTDQRPMILAHYMPWFEADNEAGLWGWHWTMNHFDPNRLSDGQRQLASHYYPKTGPYDSSDLAIIEYHLLTMKMSGIDGVIIDWYGRTEHNDYLKLHQNTQRIIEVAERIGLKYAICYEDQTLKQLAKAKKLVGNDKVEHVVAELLWLNDNWFQNENYVRFNEHPVLLSFGQTGLSDEQWKTALGRVDRPIAYFSQHHQRESASGAFDWPQPNKGIEATKEFNSTLGSKRNSITVAYPRFHDIYAQANVQPSHGRIKYNDGKTFEETLRQAVDSNSFAIQIATWNDWGEGTIIEPSREFGTRDLLAIQRARRRIDPSFELNPYDIALPARLLKARQNTEQDHAAINAIADDLIGLKTSAARNGLNALVQDLDATEYLTKSEIFYRNGDSDLTEYMRERCFLDIYYPTNRKNFPTVVWFHAGGLKSGNKEVPAELKEKGIAVVAVNYRLHPKAQAPAYIEDAAAATAWVFENIEQFGGDRNKIFVSGHSAGGYLTSMIGLDKSWMQEHEIDADEIAGLVPFSGHSITHMTVRAEQGIPDKQPTVDELSPLYHVRNDCPPMLVITGDRELEMLGRYEETAYFWRMMQVNGHPQTDLIELKGYDHGKMAKPAFPYLVQFIRNHSDNNE